METGNITADELIDEIYAALRQDELEPGEFTLVQFMERTGLTRQRAESKLMQLVAMGIIEPVDKTVVIDGKANHKVYRKKGAE
jgi:hypothetical protein